jgi:hypothetical protein
MRAQLGRRSSIAAVYSAAAFLARPVPGTERLDARGSKQEPFDRWFDGNSFSLCGASK